MDLKLKESPREWRKAGCLGALGFAAASSLLRWRRVLPAPIWIAILCVLAVVAATAWMRPRWFRGYYRFTARLGFAITRIAGCVILAFFFFIIVTPLGLILRMFGQDPLRLRRPPNASTYWSEARPKTPFDRLF
ncbi:MAG TPA: SxtJ family membrane protein [Verrucomicrobiae bacterium]|jgi:hypothetical protein